MDVSECDTPAIRIARVRAASATYGQVGLIETKCYLLFHETALS